MLFADKSYIFALTCINIAQTQIALSDFYRKKMKEFFKNTLSATLGTLVAFLIIGVFGFMLIATIIIAGTPATATITPNSILKIELNGILEERHIDSPWNDLLGEDYPTIGLDQILRSIQYAKHDKNIKAIYIEAGMLGKSSPAMNEEIRRALLDYKESGKPIISYGDNYTQGSYYICSAADQVLLNPSGQIMWQGLASELVFYKDILQRAGIQMQVFRVGTYKSAVEPFTNTEMSEANRKQVQSYLNSIWDNMLQDVSVSRKLKKDTLNQYADAFLTLAPATEMTDKQLADTLIYREDIKDYLQAKLNLKNKPHFITPTEILSQPTPIPSKDKIAVYYAFGDIVDVSSSMSSAEIASKKVCQDLEELAADNQIKAVVLRINSGGGSAYASEQIWHCIQKLKSKKPVVVSMGGMAASGGYYMACAADEIVALPTTLTGSIGIFGMIPDASNLLKDKLGLHFESVKTNQHADFGTISRPFNPCETALMQRYIESGYQLFLKRVADGRKLSLEKVAALAEGRVWTGQQASGNGLVDTLGTLQTAIEITAKRAHIDNYITETYPKEQKWYESLIERKQGSYLNATLKSVLGHYYPSFYMIHKLKDMNPIQARVPFELNINE